MLKLYLWIRNLLADEEGQTLTEYALILVLIAVVSIGVMAILGEQINNVFTNITGELTGAGAGP